jgi:haloalkane dehalogenase
MTVFRTPDERFEGLPGYDYAPHYVEVDGLRLHHLDEGTGPTVLCFHGEPDWCYLYRHMLDALVASGHRVVCPDLVGFGRSDKPTDQAFYTYERHVQSVTAHLDTLDLQDVTVVVQDWGGPIGLRWAMEHADQVGRLVIMNTGLFTGRVSKGFMAWRTFAENTPDLPIGVIMQNATTTDLSPEIVAAYEAPFPTAESKAGARRFPLLVPLTAEEQVRIEGAAHFLQEDRGERIADEILRFLA